MISYLLMTVLSPLTLKFDQATPQLHPVSVQREVMSQICIDRTTSCLLDSAMVRFLYELICRFGCFTTQINDQGREFVNSVCDELHRLTGVKQKVTSAYHPQIQLMFTYI